MPRPTRIIWAETYDRKLTDIFAVQSDVAENIAKSLRAKLSPTERQAVSAKPTQNSEAYDAYLRGLAIWNSLDISPQALERMVQFYRAQCSWTPISHWRGRTVYHSHARLCGSGTVRRAAG